MKTYEKIVYAVLVFIILALLAMKFSKSGYQGLMPQDIMIKGQGNEQSSIFDLKHDISCVPGPQETAASYSKSLTPGGYCGDQQWVAQQANYTITDGIGSSLLS